MMVLIDLLYMISICYINNSPGKVSVKGIVSRPYAKSWLKVVLTRMAELDGVIPLKVVNLPRIHAYSYYADYNLDLI